MYLCWPQVLIDDNGDAEGNFSVVAALPDDGARGARISMQPVGYFAYSHANGTQAALPVSVAREMKRWPRGVAL